MVAEDLLLMVSTGSALINKPPGKTNNAYGQRRHVMSSKKAEQQASDECYNAEADKEDVKAEVTMGGGNVYKFTLPWNSSVLTLKQHLAHDAGFKPEQTRMFVEDSSREEGLGEGEGLGRLRYGKGLPLMITMLVEEPDAQEVVPRLRVKADLVLGDGTAADDTTPGDDGQLGAPRGVAFVPAHTDWVITTELNKFRIKISNIRTGALICKFGEWGSDEGQFSSPWGVAITSDSAFVLVVDYGNDCINVLQLVVASDRSNAHLKFVHHIGKGWLNYPMGVALLPGEGAGQETVLVTDGNNHVSQFKLDGTFIRIFAGTRGSGNGEFTRPCAITVLGSSGEVAVADYGNNRVQYFGCDGKYKRQFGSFGQEADGQFHCPSALASDAHDNLLVLDITNRLQVFTPEGKHLCTRNDLSLHDTSTKGIAWSAAGDLAAADSGVHTVRVWLGT
jgi:DNA-binding beta-propeller fold protein YncE